MRFFPGEVDARGAELRWPGFHVGRKVGDFRVYLHAFRNGSVGPRWIRDYIRAEVNSFPR